MADVSHLISLGLGAPADIPHFVLFGLSPTDVGAIDPTPDVTIEVRPQATIQDGGLVTKDAGETLLYVMDYDRNLAAGVEFASVGAFTITPATSPPDLIQASEALLLGNRKARVMLSGGVVGVTYTIEHAVATNESPAQVKSKLFYLLIT